jgi:hypothetical protein
VENGCGVKSQTASLGTTLCGQRTTESFRRDVVDERSPPVDLDDGQHLAVARLELGIAADVDLLEVEAELRLRADDNLARALAQVAAGGVVETDARYG